MGLAWPIPSNIIDLLKMRTSPKLDKANAARMRRAIETRLLVAPQDYGEPLRRTLKGYWKLRVGDYRVVFRVKGEEILILGILHRKEVYEIVEKVRTANS